MRKSIRRHLAVTTAAAMALTGALAVTGPAEAKRRDSNYAFNGSGFGTSVSANTLGVKSGPTAWSPIDCTRQTGIKRRARVAAVDAPKASSLLKVGAVTTDNRTYRTKGGRVGIRARSRIANVVLGDPDGMHLAIRGLVTTSNAFASRNGKLHAKATYRSTSIKGKTGNELLDKILDKTGSTVNDLLKFLRGRDGGIYIKGLGRISLGRTIERAGRRSAVANAMALQVALGKDAPGEKADLQVVIGRARSRIAKHVPSGVFVGAGSGIKGRLLKGVGKIGPIARQPIACEGTRGKTRRNTVAGLNPLKLGIADIDAITGRANGRQMSRGRAKAWTEGRLAGISLLGGKLKITGVVARANARLRHNGRVRTTAKGTRVARIVFDGKRLDIPSPRRALRIPGVAKIQFKVKKRTRRSIRVVALRVTLLEENVVLELGRARVGIKRH